MDLHLTPSLQQFHDTTARLAAGLRAWGRLILELGHSPLTTGDIADQVISHIAHSAATVERNWQDALDVSHIYQHSVFSLLFNGYSEDEESPMYNLLKTLLLNDDDWNNRHSQRERHDDYDAAMRYLLNWLYHADRLDDLQPVLQERQKLSGLSALRPEDDLQRKRLLQLSMLSALYDTVQNLPTHDAPWSWREPVVLDQFFMSLAGPQHDRPTYDLSAIMVKAVHRTQQAAR